MNPRLRRRAEAALAVATAAVIVVGALWGSEFDGSGPGPAGADSGSTAVPLDRDVQRPAALTGTPVFDDEFDGTAGSPASPANWQQSTGGYGFGNGELECNADDRRTSALDGTGQLVISAFHEAGFQCVDGKVTNYYSARLSGAGLRPQLYGRIRVRASLPTSPGIWPAIWALGSNNPVVGWPESGELDIAEVIGSRPATVFQTLHGPKTATVPYSLQRVTTLPAPASDGFHVYGLDWTPSSLTFTIDDHVTGTFTRAQVEKQGKWVFDKPFFLLLDVAVGGDFPGPPTERTTFPQRMIVDYVRVYR